MQSIDLLDSALNKWFDNTFFKDVFLTMVLINEENFNLWFRSSNGNLSPSIKIKLNLQTKLRQYYYRNVLIIRTPDISISNVIIT